LEQDDPLRQHAFTFDLETGEGLNCPGYRIERYAVTEEDGKIFLRIDSTKQPET
jgi:nitrite reductase/ring-hydroxylating ferredoxin subunit